MKRAGLEHRGEEAPMPMMMSLIRAAATAGCEYCPNGIMEMSTLGTTTLLVDLAQLVEQGSVKEFEKNGARRRRERDCCSFRKFNSGVQQYIGNVQDEYEVGAMFSDFYQM